MELLQAEEAQRERKKRKLANTRKLEMERRQKERVEEVRETQKKVSTFFSVLAPVSCVDLVTYILYFHL